MATLILLACRKLPLWAIVLICIAVYAATPFLRGWSDYLSFWGGALEMPPGISEVLPGIMLDPTGDYTPVWEFTKIISGLFVNGFFPIFPWIIFPLTGFMMGRSLVEDKLRASAPFILFIAFLFCVMGLGGASASQQIGHRSPMDHFISLPSLSIPIPPRCCFCRWESCCSPSSSCGMSWTAAKGAPPARKHCG